MIEFSNNEKEIISTPQEVYDTFNTLIFSDDTKILGKFIAKVELFNLIKDIPGDIVECGVFKGSGILNCANQKNIISQFI